MYEEPWSDISEYPEGHGSALERELRSEVGLTHPLYEKSFSIIAKREDRDDVLVKSDSLFFVVHLTWSGCRESESYPLTDIYSTEEDLRIRLESDIQNY